ncbi:hypothetical protein [Aureimonas populi]|uniref:Surface antigen domain-containing protein n=1 Tax=Aureimonas populi TaxID=1701758 RepID=A0ABW5CMT0_9HYPH|nr:hypothetical protein [Aureimonas populi]
MRTPSTLLFLCLATAALGGCLSGGPGRSLAPASTSVAALQGGLIGQSTALSLPADAQRKALEAEYQALQFGRVGMPVTWEEDGLRGEVVPTQLYRVGSQDCRGYTHTVQRNGASVRQVGTACRSGELWTPVA